MAHILRAPRYATLMTSACAAGALVVSAAPVLAGCNSGSTGLDHLLNSQLCQANASATGATAVGHMAGAVNTFATAIGYLALATGYNGSAFGSGAHARGYDSTAVGVAAGYRDPPNTAAGYTAIGAYAGYGHVLGRYSTTIGATFSTGGDSAAARALGAYSIAIGGGDGGGNAVYANRGARANSDYAIAIGTGAVAQGLRSVSLGGFAGDNGAAGNHRNSAFGAEAGRYVTGAGNTAAGLAAGHTVKGDLNSALGNSAGQAVTGNNNLAGGVLAGVTVKGSYNAAYGDNAGRNVTGNNNIALGRNAGMNITASNTVAIGTSARATASQAVAIGYASLANVANTVSVGNGSVKRRIMNVANAVAANDAVNLAQAQALAAEAVAAAPAARAQPLDDLRNELAELRALVKQQQQEIAELRGRAVTAAMWD